MAEQQSQHVLSGFRVLDITQFIAGPTATRFLAQMGAEVIKIEIAPIGDRARVLPVLKNGRSSHFVQHNVGKKSLCLDLKHPRAMELIKKLLAQVDVFCRELQSRNDRTHGAPLRSKSGRSIRAS